MSDQYLPKLVTFLKSRFRELSFICHTQKVGESIDSIVIIFCDLNTRFADKTPSQWLVLGGKIATAAAYSLAEQGAPINTTTYIKQVERFVACLDQESVN